MPKDSLHPDFLRAFQDGAIFPMIDEDNTTFLGEIVVHPLRIAHLTLPTGQIVACDPFVSAWNTPPFTRTVAPGTYPVQLSIAVIGPDHERVACAQVQFRDRVPTRPKPNIADTRGKGDNRDGKSCCMATSLQLKANAAS